MSHHYVNNPGSEASVTEEPTEPKLAFGVDGRMYGYRDKRLMSLQRQLKKGIMQELGLTSGRQWDRWRRAHKTEWQNLQQGAV